MTIPERNILVAGDVCLDVVGVPLPPSTDPRHENWRQTGETRAHYLPGGAILLTEMIRAAFEDAEPAAEHAGTGQQGEEAPREDTAPVTAGVSGPLVCPPDLPGCIPQTLSTAGLLQVAERLRRSEIVHSSLEACFFPASTADAETKVLRVSQELGYSGPIDGSQPELAVTYPDCSPEIVVLSDTGNEFRKASEQNPWPPVVNKLCAGTLIVYKLHAPLPTRPGSNALWDELVKNNRGARIVVVSVDDLRRAGAAISSGLSWERTALDIVWHLLNMDELKLLADCPRLIVRLGLEGALLWQSADGEEPAHSAALVYDPEGIEGSYAAHFGGRMSAYGSAFTAALVHALAQLQPCRFDALLAPRTGDRLVAEAEGLTPAVKAGLAAARNLLDLGFGLDSSAPHYPGPRMFRKRKDKFADSPVPKIPGALHPDRSYWRLLDSIFASRSDSRHRAVALVASDRLKHASDAADTDAAAALSRAPVARFGALRTYDRREMEQYRALQRILCDYLTLARPQRPLSVAVFGPPGAGKSFGVTEVAASIKGHAGFRDTAPLTFNLSLYSSPEELAAAFHLIRDIGLSGDVPLVFFDEFDTPLDRKPLGWLRSFLAPMQDGKFLDRGVPHPIGPAIFVFAGGTCGAYSEFVGHDGMTAAEFRTAKGPDFLSRLRHTLDIPGLNFLLPYHPPPRPPGSGLSGASGAPCSLASAVDTFDPYGPAEQFPCEAAILLRRAAALAFNLRKKAPHLARADGALEIDPRVLRALLRVSRLEYGNRSFEALLDMSHLVHSGRFTPHMLPPSFQAPLHVDAVDVDRLIATEYPFPQKQRELMAAAIHEQYRRSRGVYDMPGGAAAAGEDASLNPWDNLADGLRQTNLEQADDIAVKLRLVGLWFRESRGGSATTGLTGEQIEMLARLEHDRWSAQKRRQGWIASTGGDRSSRNNELLLHNCLFPWEELTDEQKELDLASVRAIPAVLAAAGYEIIKA